ncbi:serine/arginine-rich splicing factor SR45 [Artemisia annua]|uniref:Serine/arginine-rich splicing factor SR45 n=1 Tax=Artemisia annua TaxID=35608 RepID=A0A2U1N6D6_ARTAN|nr:serine/arginine-rich splicing factor SR45 [Artemisia annua]
MDPTVNLPRGSGYVEFKTRSDAKKAQLHMDGESQLHQQTYSFLNLSVERFFERLTMEDAVRMLLGTSSIGLPFPVLPVFMNWNNDGDCSTDLTLVDDDN